MTTQLAPSTILRIFDNSGNLAIGGLVYTYIAGSSTPAATYTDSTGTTQNTNPIVANSRGEVTIWLDPTVVYKFVVYDASSNLLWSRDQISSNGGLSQATGATQIGTASGQTLQQVLTNSTAKVIDSIITLRSLNKIQNTLAMTEGWASPGDGGGGYYYYDSTDTSSVDNGGTIIVATDGGRWKLIHFGEVSVLQFGAIPNGIITTTAMFTAWSNAWNAALAATFNLYVPAGVYDVGINNFPMRQSAVTALLDCKNIVIRCEGPATVLKTTSSAGADVLQLNGLMNFHIKGFPTLTGVITTATASGSNGCSVTNGYDNITLEITPTNCDSIDKGTFIDGGKGLTIQTPNASTTVQCGTLIAKVNAKGCVHGFGLEQDIVAATGKKGSIVIDLVAENCFIAATYSAGAAAGGSVPAGFSVGLKLRGQSINCQKSVVLGRAHGVDIDMQVISTATAAAKRLNPKGVAWFAADTIVEGLFCAYAQDSRISVYGNVGSGDKKARIGGASAGTSGLIGATYGSEIYLDLGGSTVTNVENVDSGGNSVSNSRIYASPTTAITLPIEWYVPALNNTLTIGPNPRFVNPTIATRLSFAYGADGKTETGAIMLSGSVTGLQGKGISAANAPVTGLFDNSGTMQFGIVNGSGIVLPSATSSAALGAYISKVAIYKTDGTLLGYFPIYG